MYNYTGQNYVYTILNSRRFCLLYISLYFVNPFLLRVCMDIILECRFKMHGVCSIKDDKFLCWTELQLFLYISLWRKALFFVSKHPLHFNICYYLNFYPSIPDIKPNSRITKQIFLLRFSLSTFVLSSSRFFFIPSCSFPFIQFLFEGCVLHVDHYCPQHPKLKSRHVYTSFSLLH